MHWCTKGDLTCHYRRCRLALCFLILMTVTACISILLGVLVMNLRTHRPLKLKRTLKIQAIPSEYNERLNHIEKICHKYKLHLHPSVWKRKLSNFDDSNATCSSEWCTLVVDESARVLSCLLPKVACTTVKRFFIRLLTNHSIHYLDSPNQELFHQNADKTLRRVTTSYYSSNELKKFYKFMLVRHPFERIVSAFVDKALNPRSATRGFYRNYWIPIMKQAGRKVITTSSQPTFREFVHYLLRLPVEKYTEHWAPYWRRCEPCIIKYDFVGRLENGDVDVPYAFKRYPVSNMTFRWNRGLNTSAKTKDFFAELNASEIFGLYSKYFLDFELFGYTIDEYIEGKDVSKMDILKLNHNPS